MSRVLLAVAVCVTACPTPVPPPSRHVQLIAAPPGDDVAALVAQQLRKTPADRVLLVYVGASWCEPCERFRRAAGAGQLDGELGQVDLLVFDADADAERLARAGYTSRMIPLLVEPGADGKATDRRMEGSVKGDGALANMVPRLKDLLRR